jgi:hypothetical protein
MKMKKLYYSNAAPRYNHGCQDSATWQDNGDGTATCLEATSCHSCWQVGHDYDHIYAEVGEVRPIDALPDLED